MRGGDCISIRTVGGAVCTHSRVTTSVWVLQVARRVNPCRRISSGMHIRRLPRILQDPNCGNLAMIKSSRVRRTRSTLHRSADTKDLRLRSSWPEAVRHKVREFQIVEENSSQTTGMSCIESIARNPSTICNPSSPRAREREHDFLHTTKASLRNVPPDRKLNGHQIPGCGSFWPAPTCFRPATGQMECTVGPQVPTLDGRRGSTQQEAAVLAGGIPHLNDAAIPTMFTQYRRYCQKTCSASWTQQGCRQATTIRARSVALRYHNASDSNILQVSVCRNRCRRDRESWDLLNSGRVGGGEHDNAVEKRCEWLAASRVF